MGYSVVTFFGVTANLFDDAAESALSVDGCNIDSSKSFGV